MKCAGFVAILSTRAVRTAKFPATTARQVSGCHNYTWSPKMEADRGGEESPCLSVDKMFPRIHYFWLHFVTVWSKCEHAFHMHCIVKWLQAQNVRQQCPMCRRDWEYRA